MNSVNLLFKIGLIIVMLSFWFNMANHKRDYRFYNAFEVNYVGK